MDEFRSQLKRKKKRREFGGCPANNIYTVVKEEQEKTS
jgi:hypothetical protein